MEKNELVITRVFDAPKEKVWKAWTEPEEFKKWWGPKDFTAPHVNIDLKVGGKFLGSMRGPEGSPFDKEMWSTGTYKEIIPPSEESRQAKIVVSDSFADEKGNAVPSSYYGMEDFPLEMLVTVTFEESDGGTKMTLLHSGIENISETERNNMEQGWNESFDKLQKSLKK